MEWKFLQTPLFTLSSTAKQLREVELEIEARHGSVTNAVAKFRDDRGEIDRQVALPESIIGRRLHEKMDWEGFLLPEMNANHQQSLARWLGDMLPQA